MSEMDQRRTDAVQAALRAIPERVPPYSVESEKGVLGCLISDAKYSLSICRDIFAGIEAPFYDPRNASLYDIIVAMEAEMVPVDMVTLVTRLQERNLLETVGGFAAIADMVNAVPSAANLAYYAKPVREKAILRRVIRVCTKAVSDAYEASDMESTLDNVEANVLAIRPNASTKGPVTMLDIAGEVMANMEARHNGQTGIPTGYPDLDRLTNGGLQAPDMWVLAARPSMGKTSFAMNIAEHAAGHFATAGKDEHVVVFSLEMSSAALGERIMSSMARVNTRKKGMTDVEMCKLTDAVGRMTRLPIVIDDDSSLTITAMRSRARNYKSKRNVGLIVVDYLQLIPSEDGAKADARRQSVDLISNGLKSMAKELGIPVIVVAQLNRDLERDKERKPRLSDLRESGQIEQDADVVGMLYTDPKNAGDDPNIVPVKLLIAKQRNGPRNVDVPLTFLAEFTRFESASNFRGDDIPDHSHH